MTASEILSHNLPQAADINFGMLLAIASENAETYDPTWPPEQHRNWVTMFTRFANYRGEVRGYAERVFQVVAAGAGLYLSHQLRFDFDSATTPPEFWGIRDRLASEIEVAERHIESDCHAATVRTLHDQAGRISEMYSRFTKQENSPQYDAALRNHMGAVAAHIATAAKQELEAEESLNEANGNAAIDSLAQSREARRLAET